MNFLNQLKSQASALQSQQTVELQNFEASTHQTELACQTVWLYFGELAKQLNVITPAGPKLAIEPKKPWPEMKLTDFRVDARKKKLRDKDVYDTIAMGWQIVPQVGEPLNCSVSVNFPPDLERIEKRLAAGNVRHERINQRHPEKNTLQAIVFEFLTQARGSVNVTADHDNGQLVFRLANLNGFEVITTTWSATDIQGRQMDELAKMIVGRPSRFVFAAL